MQYILMDYVNEDGWPQLTKAEPDLDAAISWAARSPTALHGVVEVRPRWDGTLLTTDVSDYLTSE